MITAVAGNGMWSGYGGDDGPATSAWLYEPFGVVVDAAGNLYIADPGIQRIRKVTAAGAPLSYPQTNVGSVSPTQTVTVSNIGTSTLTFAGFAASANFAIDASATTCSTSSPLVAGNSCTVGVCSLPQPAAL